ncbi:hypothetical protein MNB_SV-12-967 [hydrothermal vent metagenome]|uniref:Uncharacterized protein n=1 Tax=hydrothermal vent metagenome TaxID=652676 RepID=A0A1W1BMK7_9ZZZZ
MPFVVTKTVDLLAGGATPIILISLGIFLARELPKNIDFYSPHLLFHPLRDCERTSFLEF